MEMEKGSSRVIPGITSDLGSSACLRESAGMFIYIYILSQIDINAGLKEFG